MSGVWTFKNGVTRLDHNRGDAAAAPSSRKVLCRVGNEDGGEETVIDSYSVLETHLLGLGWEKFNDGEDDKIQYHKRSCLDLISLPKEFSKFSSVFMYDIVVKNPNVFKVKDAE